MSAIATKIVEKYKLTSKMNISELGQYTSEFLENLTDNRKRNQARRCLRDSFKFSSEQRSSKTKTINFATSDRYQDPILIPQELKKETIKKMTHRFLQNKLSIRNIRAEAYALALSALNANAESVKERLDSYDTSTLPNLQALADVMIMLCIHPAELISLRITDAGKNQERAKELLTWIQNAISSDRIGDPGAVYAVIIHETKNLTHAMTITEKALHHNLIITPH
ncbi:16992_t:CDS:2, partial [Cetraspora pellucida]